MREIIHLSYATYGLHQFPRLGRTRSYNFRCSSQAHTSKIVTTHELMHMQSFASCLPPAFESLVVMVAKCHTDEAPYPTDTVSVAQNLSHHTATMTVGPKVKQPAYVAKFECTVCRVISAADDLNKTRSVITKICFPLLLRLILVVARLSRQRCRPHGRPNKVSSRPLTFLPVLFSLLVKYWIYL